MSNVRHPQHETLPRRLAKVQIKTKCMKPSPNYHANTDTHTHTHIASTHACNVVSNSATLRCVQLCYPTDCSPPDSSSQGIFQARILKWVAISFSKLVKVNIAQSCPDLCNPMGHTVHGILWARILEWVSFPFSRQSSHPRDRTQVSCIAGRFFTS